MINLFASIFLLIIGISLAYYEIKLIKSHKLRRAIIFSIIRLICFFGTGFFLSEFIKYLVDVKTLIF
jgi:divalent metal cation (Fe/Co/Zn/Cd) transporter